MRSSLARASSTWKGETWLDMSKYRRIGESFELWEPLHKTRGGNGPGPGPLSAASDLLHLTVTYCPVNFVSLDPSVVAVCIYACAFPHEVFMAVRSISLPCLHTFAWNSPQQRSMKPLHSRVTCSVVLFGQGGMEDVDCQLCTHLGVAGCSIS